MLRILSVAGAGLIAPAAIASDSIPTTIASRSAPAAAESAPLVAGSGTVARATTLIDGKPASPKDVPFMHGEELTFSGTWMNINVGTGILSVETDTTFDGKPAIRLKGDVKSNARFSLFFAIDDAGESWIDPVGLYSLGFISDQQEGNISDYQRWTFDYDNGVAKRKRTRRKADGPVERSDRDYPLTATHVQDPASMVYFFRAFDLKVGQKLESKVFVSRKVWDLEVNVLSKETVKVPAGTFECLKIKPKVSLNGKPQKKGEMTLWVTDDERKMPVKIVSEVPLGKISLALIKYKEGKTK